MPYKPIEDHGMIGDMHTVALVGTDGAIDWLCVPHFDSPSVFGAILDDEKGGRFKIAPVGDDITSKQFYWPIGTLLATFNRVSFTEEPRPHRAHSYRAHQPKIRCQQNWS